MYFPDKDCNYRISGGFSAILIFKSFKNHKLDHLHLIIQEEGKYLLRNYSYMILNLNFYLSLFFPSQNIHRNFYKLPSVDKEDDI